MRFSALLLSFALALGASVAFADGETPTATTAASPPTAKAPPPGFVPIAGKESAAESVSASLLVVLAYAAFLGGSFGYVIYLAQRQSALARELQALSRKLQK